MIGFEKSSIISIILHLASDTDSGHGTSIATTTDSPKGRQENGTIEASKRRTLVKGLINIGNTCFFHVIVQVCHEERGAEFQ